MTDEEKKAIEYVKEFIEELQCDINMFGFEDDCEEEQNLLVEQRDNFKTILNLIQKQQAEIEEWKIEYNHWCQLAIDRKKELEKKDKIIDVIVQEYEYNAGINVKNFCEEEMRKDKCIQDCRCCIKQYFERKVEE